jgi:hypothetical protein
MNQGVTFVMGCVGEDTVERIGNNKNGGLTAALIYTIVFHKILIPNSVPES